MRFNRAILFSALLGTAAAVQAGSFNDNFATSQSGVSLFSPGTTSTSPLTIAPGIDRVLTNDQISNDDPGGSRSRVAVSGGSFNLSNDEDVVSSGTVKYQFASPLDLSGLTSFKLGFLSNDIAGTATITLFDFANATRTYTAAIPGGNTGNPFNLLLISSGGIGDLSQIDHLWVKLAPDDVGGDLSLGSIQSISSVPGPSALAMFGILGLSRLRRSRK